MRKVMALFFRLKAACHRRAAWRLMRRADQLSDRSLAQMDAAIIADGRADQWA